MKKSMKLAAILALGFAAQGQAAEVVCGDNTLGIRVTMVDPGLQNGLCWATNGNLDPLISKSGVLTVNGTALQLIEKDVTSTGSSNNTGALGYTGGGAVSGDWSLSYSNWLNWDRLFLAFHFGNAGDTSLTNPDSFVVELAPTDVSGQWSLGPDNARLNGLSNIYLFGNSACVNNCGRPPQRLPEPGTLALAGLSLLAVAGLRRRQARR